MSEFTSGNVPGFRPQVVAEESQVWWAGRGGQTLLATRKALLAANSVDSGNTPPTTLRAGLVLGIRTATGEAAPYDPTANDGTQIAVGVLERSQSVLVDGVATPRFTQMLVSGLLRESALIGLDPRARQQLSGRFQFAGEPHSPGALLAPRGVQRKSGSYTVQPEDDGCLLIATATATFTLPPKQNGLSYRFLQSVDATLTIAGDADLLLAGEPAGSTVQFSESNARIGSHVLVECVYTSSSTLAWLVTNLGGTPISVS